METLDYSNTAPPSRHRFAVAGFWVAAVSLAITLTYVTILMLRVRDGAQATTFRLSVVQLVPPVAACVLCGIGWSRSQRRLSVVGTILAVLSFTVILVMGSRFWP